MPTYTHLPLLGVLVILLISCGAEEYYVTPTPPPNSGCSQFAADKPCFTLDHYANNSDYFNGKKNITVVFLEGVHNLTLDLRLWDIENITLRGRVSTGQANTPVIVQLQHGNITLGMVSGLVIEYLTVNSRGDASIKMSQAIATHMVLRCVSIFDTSIFLRGNSLQGTLLISQSVLVSSGTILSLANQSNFEIVVKDSVFQMSSEANPLSVQATTSTITVHLDNITTVDKKEKGEANPAPLIGCCNFYDICIGTDKVRVSVNILNSNFSRSYGTGIYIVQAKETSLDLNITRSVISNHQQGALVVSSGDTEKDSLHVRIKSSLITHNYYSIVHHNGNPYERQAAAAGISIYGEPLAVDTVVEIRNTTIAYNRDFHGEPIIVWLFQCANITIVDSEFRDNMGSAIAALNSEILLGGNVSFVKNSASQGGAMALSLTYIYIARDARVVFEGNSANDVGGAVHISQKSIHQYPDNDRSKNVRCFYLLSDWDETGDYFITFVHNTAKHGGEHVYGASLQSYCVAGYTKDGQTVRSHFVQHFFHFEPNQTFSPSPVSSDVTRVCMCSSVSGQYNCTNITELFWSVRAIPGEQFNLSVVVVGSQFGTGTGSVYAQFLPLAGQSDAQLSQQYQYSQGIRNYTHCTELKYSVCSANHLEVIALTVTDGTVDIYGNREAIEQYIEDYSQEGVIPPTLLTTPMYINVTLLTCPPGFNLSGDPPRCVCYHIFEQNSIRCTVTGGVGYVHRNGTLWVNASHDGNETTGVILHKYCPFGYCKPQFISVNLDNPDTQCDFDRSGTLCGACRKGYSAALGTSKCLKCPNNNHLALLLFFAVSGILLVLFIKVLNLTVTQGTINGLIFYANIVWANNSNLYPHEDHSGAAGVFFKTFIAWLNLDFGIETCFIEGMDAYWKTWLQFAFPFYIWIIAGVIIIASRYSKTLTNYFGNNSVHVLATLFLLSYSKLLRTIITALGVATLVEYPSGQELTVWSFDGNVSYCGIPHIFLFLAALAALLFLWLPYTSVLLFVQLLKRFSEFKVLRWIDKMKPIFDAYFAPLKDKHHYWVGVLLLVRGILLITIALTSANNPSANFLALIIITAALLAYTSYTGHLYKKNYVSFLETLSFFNLILLGGGALYIEQAGGNKAALAFTSVGIAFIQFMGTILINVWLLIVARYCKRTETRSREPGYESITRSVSHIQHRQKNDENEEYSRLREPLLEDSSYTSNEYTYS